MTLPGGAPPSSSSSSFLSGAFGSSSKGNDGSARSIHLQSQAMLRWKRSSKAVKITYSVALVSLMVVIMGWRVLTYNSAQVYLECSNIDCNLVLNGVGRAPKIRMTIPRHQVIGARPAKVNPAGLLVNDNVDINSEWKFQQGGGKKGKKKNKQSQNYKGPDKDGNYLTYFVTLRDVDPAENGRNTEGVEGASVDLSPIQSFAVLASSYGNDEDNNPSNQNHGGAKEYRIVMRQHGINQTRRRVRNMVQKIDSYAKKRRHKLTVKESSSPDWRGVLMLVLGGCAFLLSLLLAIFWEDEESQARQPSGPGARRRDPHNDKYSKSKASPSTNPYQRTTPSRYEVNTLPRKGTSGQMRRRN